MTLLISMIRGINVGGARPLRMADLRALYEALGFSAVRTYLQSGNVVCEAKGGDAAAHAAAVERAILGRFGHEVSVAALTSKGLAAVVASNPLLGKRSVDPQFLHATFLIGARGASLRGLELPLGPREDAVLAGDVVYLYCPNGYGVTKINNGLFERIFSCGATTRNWRTVVALDGMARGEPA